MALLPGHEAAAERRRGGRRAELAAAARRAGRRLCLGEPRRAGLGLVVGKPVIHYGRFATGLFQTIYSPPRLWWPLVALSLEWWLVICLLIGLAQVFHPAFFRMSPHATPDEAFTATLNSQLT